MARDEIFLYALIGLGVFLLSNSGSQAGYFDPNAPPAPQPGGGSTNTGTATAPQTSVTMGNMVLSSDGLAFIQSQEGLSLSAYEDPPGSNKYSIGYGHQIVPGDGLDSSSIITEDEALQLLNGDTAKAQSAVNSLVTVPLSQGQFDALVDFAYNEGVGAFAGSTLLATLNSGDYAGASQDFASWVFEHVGGVKQVSQVLVARRQGEQQLFTA
jgi:lysozyme